MCHDKFLFLLNTVAPRKLCILFLLLCKVGKTMDMLYLCIFYSFLFCPLLSKDVSFQRSKWMCKGFCLKPIALSWRLPFLELPFQHHLYCSQVSRNTWTDICNPDFQSIQWYVWTSEPLRICSKPLQTLMSVSKRLWCFYAEVLFSEVSAFSVLLNVWIRVGEDTSDQKGMNSGLQSATKHGLQTCFLLVRLFLSLKC